MRTPLPSRASAWGEQAHAGGVGQGVEQPRAVGVEGRRERVALEARGGGRQRAARPRHAEVDGQRQRLARAERPIEDEGQQPRLVAQRVGGVAGREHVAEAVGEGGGERGPARGAVLHGDEHRAVEGVGDAHGVERGAGVEPGGGGLPHVGARAGHRQRDADGGVGREPAARVARHAVAVGVLRDAALHGARVRRRIDVVAVARRQRPRRGRRHAGDEAQLGEAVAVAVEVGVPGERVVDGLVGVGQAVAVVVEPVAVLLRARVHGGLRVVAVVADGDRALAGPAGGVRVAVAVAVGVDEPALGRVLVDGTVAVVVDPVARVVAAGVDPRVGVVAVGGHVGIARARGGGIAAVHRVRADGAIPVRICVEEPVALAQRRGAVGRGVDRAVAVVVAPVAVLGRPGVDEGIAIVAVLGGGPAVAIEVAISRGGTLATGATPGRQGVQDEQDGEDRAHAPA
ncbi:MAG: hypothetical protein R3F59_36195 [Myxococcota bacterium]